VVLVGQAGSLGQASQENKKKLVKGAIEFTIISRKGALEQFSSFLYSFDHQYR